MNNINEIPLVRLSAHSVLLEDVDNVSVAKQMYMNAIPIEQECPEYGHVSRGFLQYEDLVVPVSKEIKHLEQQILQTIQQISGKKHEIDDIWGVVLTKGQSVIAHSHKSNLHANPAEHFSFAYYPDVPDGAAELIFMVGYADTMQTTVAIKPQVGLLVIFNSYVTHMTARHKSNETRLVISGNTSPLDPDTKPNADWSVYHDRPII